MYLFFANTLTYEIGRYHIAFIWGQYLYIYIVCTLRFLVVLCRYMSSIFLWYLYVYTGYISTSLTKVIFNIICTKKSIKPNIDKKIFVFIRLSRTTPYMRRYVCYRDRHLYLHKKDLSILFIPRAIWNEDGDVDLFNKLKFGVPSAHLNCFICIKIYIIHRCR